MKISRAMIFDYLTSITAYVGDNDGAPEDLSEYDEDILNVKLGAEKYGDLDCFRLAIDYLLTHPEANASSYAPIHYQYDQEEMKELLNHIKQVIWSTDSMLEREVIDSVELVDISLTDWWKSRRVKS